jgi:O-antigen/teichoic acid export membrane protein
VSASKRILSALAANVFGQAVSIGSQILLTPLFFLYWGAEKYGEWLLLSSIPAYLVMADLGIGSAAGNEMTMLAGRQDWLGAQKTFRGAFWVAGIVAAVVGLLTALLVLINATWHIPHTAHIEVQEACLVLGLLGLMVGANFFGSVISAGFRAAGANGLGTSLANVSRLLEALMQGMLLWAGQSPSSLCLGMLAAKLAMLVVQWVLLRPQAPWLFTAGVSADKTIIQRLIRPSLAFLAFPMGSALALQGPIMIIGALFGGTAVAVFSTMRTVSRILNQITGAFNASVWPEMSRAYGAGQLAAVRALHRGSWGIALVLIWTASLVLLTQGEWLVQFWLRKVDVFNAPMLLCLLVVSLVSAVWNASSVVLASINAHGRIAAAYVGVNAACLALGALLGWQLGMYGLLTALILAECLLLIYVVPQALEASGDTLPAFLQGVWGGSIERLGKLKRQLMGKLAWRPARAP